MARFLLNLRDNYTPAGSWRASEATWPASSLRFASDIFGALASAGGSALGSYAGTESEVHIMDADADASVGAGDEEEAVEVSGLSPGEPPARGECGGSGHRPREIRMFVLSAGGATWV